MSLITLPPELLDAIFESLPTTTLAALALVSSSLTPSVDRHLYRHISLSSHPPNYSAVYTLTTHPKLASLVRSFSLAVDNPDDVPTDLYSALTDALHNMYALTSLELLLPQNESWILEPRNGRPQMVYPNLQHFATSFAFGPSLVSLLSRSPSLLSLQLSSSLPSPDNINLLLPPEAAPKLSSYTGPASLLRHLFPRPLTTLFLSGDLTIQDLDHLLPSSGAPSHTPASLDTVAMADQAFRPICAPTGVQVLSAVTSAPPVLMIEALATACPRLSCLRVMTTCAFWEAPDLTFYTRIAHTLSTLAELTSFELSGMHWESRPKSPASGSLPGAKEWVSPPVTPRVTDLDFIQEEQGERDIVLNEAFLDWSF